MPNLTARRRTISLGLAALCSVSLAIAGTPAVAGAVGAAPAAVAPVAQAEPDIDAFRARAEAASAELERRTNAWRDGRRALESAEKRLKNVREQAGTARAESDQAKVDLGVYAAAAYRNQAVPEELTILMSAEQDPADALHGFAAAEVAGRGKENVVHRAERLRVEAEGLEVEAKQLAEQARSEETRLAAELESIQEEADRTSRELEEALAELARIEEERRKERERKAAAAAAKKAAAQAKADKRAAQRAAERAARSATRPSGGGGGGGGGGSCSAGAGATSGYPNGLIPSSALCSIGSGQELRADAAQAFKSLDKAYRGRFGSSICITDSYRSLAGQHAVFKSRPHLAAVPGTSNHGLGVALDLGCGINRFGSAQHKWMRDNAPSHGWIHPAWARQNGSKPEAWHWEYTG